MNLGLSLSLGGMRAGGGEPVITLAAPTWSDNFNTYADGTRLVAGDPNTNTGLINANPGNLGWDTVTSVTQNNNRFNPVIFQGVVRNRTASAGFDGAPGTQLMCPPGLTQSGNMYAQIDILPSGIGQPPSLSFRAQNQENRVDIQADYESNGLLRPRIQVTNAGTQTSVFSQNPGGTRVRMGGNGSGSHKFSAGSETLTGYTVDGRVYIRRGPGFPIGPLNGTAATLPNGNRFGFASQSTLATMVTGARVGPAPLFITVDETHPQWTPKKRSSSSEPITAGTGDQTFTGTYVGTIPSRMQWALFNLGTGAVIKDWATVPTADFTAGSGVWSARLRSIPAGLNGRGAYAVGFRPVNASNETDPAWACVSNREFYVTLNVGLLGQSNAGRLLDPVTGSPYPRVDGIMTYQRADPPSLVQGQYTPNPQFWIDTTTGVGNGRCNYVLGDYLANLYNLPVSFEALSISARGAAVLGPIDPVTGLPDPNSDWAYIQTHHAFAGGAYEVLYLAQGENENNTQPQFWLTRWTAHLAAYRDPAMHGQPPETVIPVFYIINGRATSSVNPTTDANCHLVRQLQLQLQSTVSDCYLIGSYTGVELIDEVHCVATNGEGYNEVARRIRLTYDKVFNAGAYDGRGPIATSATRSGAVITVAFDLNGATSLTTRNGTDQTASGNASVLTSWQVSADNFATTLTINSAVQTGNTVVITLASDPGGPVKVRNHYGLNPDISSFPAGSYADGTFICMMPLVNPLTTTT